MDGVLDAITGVSDGRAVVGGRGVKRAVVGSDVERGVGSEALVPVARIRVACGCCVGGTRALDLGGPVLDVGIGRVDGWNALGVIGDPGCGVCIAVE